VLRIADALTAADIEAQAVPDARVPLWEKFIYLAAYAGFSGSARQPAGPIWADPVTREQFLAAAEEIAAVARAEGVPVAKGLRDRISSYMETVPKTMRASLFIDLQAGKRIEVEALQGAVVRRGAARGVPTPIVRTLYAVLRAAATRS
jgi:2-dehydropantoate 2-reductase